MSLPYHFLRGRLEGDHEEQKRRGPFTHLVAHTYKGDWRIGTQLIYFGRRFFQIKPLRVIRSRN